MLATDSLNVTALYRVAILDGWDGQLERSLERFARLRQLAPGDEDIMVSEAAVLGWAGKLPASQVLYDSVLVHSPGRADALAGRARTVAWGGDLDRAEQLWRAALELHPDDPELLIGLAQTLSWRGRPGLAAAYAARARRLVPADTAALQLERSVRATLRPALETTIDGGGDSEDNDVVAQEATFTVPLAGDWRGSLDAGWRHATLGATAGTSYGAGGSVSAPLGSAVVRVGLGGRRLDPRVGRGTTLPTAEFGIDFHLARDAAASLGYTHEPFDETAVLIARGFASDAIEASIDLSPSPTWAVSGTLGGAWLSDGNRRLSGTGAVLVRALPGLQVGASARILAYRADLQDGYFAPNRFAVLEVRLVYAVQHGRWSVRTDGGGGAQQVVTGAALQGEWHLGLALSREWGASNEIALVGALTNSAAATSTAGLRSEVFRYRSLQLQFRQGL